MGAASPTANASPRATGTEQVSLRAEQGLGSLNAHHLKSLVDGRLPSAAGGEVPLTGLGASGFSDAVPRWVPMGAIFLVKPRTC